MVSFPELYDDDRKSTMARRGYISNNDRIVYFWTPKSACMTLFGLLQFNFGYNYKHFQRYSRPFLECQKVVHERDYRSLVLCRNPMTRSVSAFLNKFVIFKGKRIERLQDLEGFTATFMQLYSEHYPWDGKRISVTFEEYLDVVEHMFNSRQDANRNSIDGHWDTQVPPAQSEMRFQYDFVCPAEDLDSSLRRAFSSIGLKYRRTRNNSTSYSSTSAGGYLGSTPAIDIPTDQLDVSSFLNEKTRAKVESLYAIDFETFGYGSADLDALPALASR